MAALRRVFSSPNGISPFLPKDSLYSILQPALKIASSGRILPFLRAQDTAIPGAGFDGTARAGRTRTW